MDANRQLLTIAEALLTEARDIVVRMQEALDKGKIAEANDLIAQIEEVGKSLNQLKQGGSVHGH